MTSLQIEFVFPGIAHPDQDQNGIPYIKIFGLDKSDGRGGPSDGEVDEYDSYVFDLRKGLLKFPLDFPLPFNASRTQYEENANDDRYIWSESLLSYFPAPEIYDPFTQSSRYFEYSHFQFRCSIILPKSADQQ